jgi:hypothetical protein
MRVQTKARNASMQAIINTVSLALEQYAEEHDGKYPAPNAVERELCQKNYLPGNHVPRAPWSRDSARLIGLNAPNAGEKMSAEINRSRKAELPLPGNLILEGIVTLENCQPGTIWYFRKSAAKGYGLVGVGMNDTKEPLLLGPIRDFM